LLSGLCPLALASVSAYAYYQYGSITLENKSVRFFQNGRSISAEQPYLTKPQVRGDSAKLSVCYHATKHAPIFSFAGSESYTSPLKSMRGFNVASGMCKSLVKAWPSFCTVIIIPLG
jgi:hypothetical protein